MIYEKYYRYIINFGEYKGRYLSSMKTQSELEYLLELFKEGKLKEYIEYHSRVNKHKEDLKDPLINMSNEKLETSFYSEVGIYEKKIKYKKETLKLF